MGLSDNYSYFIEILPQLGNFNTYCSYNFNVAKHDTYALFLNHWGLYTLNWQGASEPKEISFFKFLELRLVAW